MTTSAWLAVLGRLFLIMVFVAAAIGKLRSREAAARALTTMLPLPDGSAFAILATIVAIEAIIALALLASAITGAWLALVFTLGATFALVGVLLRGHPAQCLCFGGEPHALSWLDAARNGIVAAACEIVIMVNAPFRTTTAETIILVGLATMGLLVTIGLPRITAVMR